MVLLLIPGIWKQEKNLFSWLRRLPAPAVDDKMGPSETGPNGGGSMTGAYLALIALPLVIVGLSLVVFRLARRPGRGE